jgi:hypothetical protein
MRTVHFRSLTLAASAVSARAGSDAARDKPSRLLNTLEAHRLVTPAERRPVTLAVSLRAVPFADLAEIASSMR